MIFLRLAWLNIRKYGKRSAIIVFAVMVSVVALEFVAGMLKFVLSGSLEYISDLAQILTTSGFGDHPVSKASLQLGAK